MTADAPAGPGTSSRFTPVLLLLFAASGACALVYELVWFHLLRLAVGASAISLAFLLGSFMGGMCLGSLLLPKLLPRTWHPLRVYALLELGIGALGAAMPWLLPQLGRFYTAHGGAGTAALVWRGAVCALALLPPTMLMGATLPAIARWLDTSPRGLARLGWFYGSNIFGAVLGTLVAGFWLLRVHDVNVATWTAVATNGAITAIALALAAVHRAELPAAPATAPAMAVPPTDAGPPRRAFAVHTAIALSGLTALGAEVVWTRLLSLLLGASVYTFSLILAVFLVGLGAGSALGSRLARSVASPRAWFGACQLALPLAIVWSALLITRVIPYAEPTWIFQPRVYQNMLVHYAWDFARCALTLLPATVLWGASFPLALAAAGRGAADPGRLVGGLYAANTVGAIAGALAFGLWATPAFGTWRSQQLLALLAGAAALLLLPGSVRWRLPLRTLAATVVVVATVGIAALLPTTPAGLIAFGRAVDEWYTDREYEFVAEGTSESVAISRLGGYQSFHVCGKVEASTEPLDMRLQRLLGHLPALVHGAPRSVLIVGCGAGVTAGCFVDHQSVERIVICEIEPKVAAASRQWLGIANRNVLRDPRTELVIDDARHFLATTHEKFDVITSDPIHPWVRGAAALYTSEYYDLVRAHLEPGGVVSQWVPLYETDTPAVKSQLGTFLRAFPFGTIWNSDPQQKGYDLVMLAQDGPTTIDVDEVQQALDADGLLRDSLQQVQLGSAVGLLSTYAGDAGSLSQWLADAVPNVDATLRLQYLAGLSLDVYREADIYGEIRKACRFPKQLFTGSPAAMAELEKVIAK